MAIIQNNIQFNNLSRIGRGSEIGNVKLPSIYSESDLKDYIDADIEYRNIQSILIDWNGAQLGDKTLNTTGEVLSSYKIAI